MFTDKIDDVFLRYAADTLAETNTGLTGSEIVRYCNGYAIDFNVNIPITSSNFGRFGSVVPNKRTALYKNLFEFNAYQQFKIIKELSELDKFSNNDIVQKLKMQLYERFGEFDKLTAPSKVSAESQITDLIDEMIKVLLEIYNTDNEIYLADGDSRLSHINNYEKVLKRMQAQGYFTTLRSDVLGGYEVELSEKCFTSSKIEERAIKKEDNKQQKDLPSVFVSYNHGSSDFVDDMIKSLTGICNVKRDKDKIGDWKSISDFMRSIRKEDFAILVITDKYLRSTACLYEVTQLMKDENWDKNTMYVVMEDAQIIYDTVEQPQYIKYWVDYCEKLSEAIKGLPPEAIYKQSEELKKATIIKNDIGEFLNKVADANNPPINNVISSIKKRINPNLA